MRAGIFALLAMVALLFAVAITSGGTASAQDVPRFALGSMVATTAQTELKDQPAADGAKLTDMPVNAQAIVLGGPFNDGWYWLNYNGIQGYAQAKTLVPIDANYKPIEESTPTTVPVVPTAPLPTATAIATDTPGVTATPTGATVPSTSGTYDNLWLAEMAKGGNVRIGPGLDQKVLKSWWAGRRVLLYEAVPDGKGALWYRVSDPPEAPMWVHSSLIRTVAPVKYEGAKYKGKWININISQQIVTAYVDGVPVKVTLASTGVIAAKVNTLTGKRDDNRTELGVWKIYYKLSKQDMKGGSKEGGDEYNLKDVPYPQYFHYSGEALHGTYWHDDFGRPHSHGCVNLSTPMAEWFYNWDKIGTIVWVHN